MGSLFFLCAHVISGRWPGVAPPVDEKGVCSSYAPLPTNPWRADAIDAGGHEVTSAVIRLAFILIDAACIPISVVAARAIAAYGSLQKGIGAKGQDIASAVVGKAFIDCHATDETVPFVIFRTGPTTGRSLALVLAFGESITPAVVLEAFVDVHARDQTRVIELAGAPSRIAATTMIGITRVDRLA